MEPLLKGKLTQIANIIRGLAIDGVQAANSGHPGMPLGCAELGAYLYGNLLRYNPEDPNWLNRDRLILSAGHGSMWLYSCLELAGFKIGLDQLARFRQHHSITPGHPEFGETPGVEATTGPLGQGIGQAVGQALGIKILGKRFNGNGGENWFDSKVYAVCGDGCMMEGIASEACSLAGHLKLNNLVIVYDANDITLDGKLEDSYSEDTGKRFEAYGWDVFKIDGNDLDQIDEVFQKIKKEQKRPTLIIAKTVIGKGSPNKAGTHKVHGSPLGPDEVKATKVALGFPADAGDFYVDQATREYFKQRNAKDLAVYNAWKSKFDQWISSSDLKAQELKLMLSGGLPSNIEQIIKEIEMPAAIEGRNASNAVVNKLVKVLPGLYGGSADLSCSDMTMLKDAGVVTPGVYEGRNIKYGVREFAMASVATGLAQTGCIIPYCGTFLTFSDYMRNAVRLAALMKIRLIFQFTHDSFYVGEDGPTHQPIEHYCSLRAIPGLQVIRPGDQNEAKQAWLAALKCQGPTALILTRQKLPSISGTEVPFDQGVGRGAYIVRKEVGGKPEVTLIATGSELSLASEVAEQLVAKGKRVRVISMPSWELLNKQPKAYYDQILGGDLGVRVSLEAGVSIGWHRFVGSDGITIAMDRFGGSAPANELAKEFGFTPEAVIAKILARLGS
jgi:transketolase